MEFVALCVMTSWRCRYFQLLVLGEGSHMSFPSSPAINELFGSWGVWGNRTSPIPPVWGREGGRWHEQDLSHKLTLLSYEYRAVCVCVCVCGYRYVHFRSTAEQLPTEYLTVRSTHTHTRTHTHGHTHTDTHTWTHTETHTRTHWCTHTHTHTNEHKHKQF